LITAAFYNTIFGNVSTDIAGHTDLSVIGATVSLLEIGRTATTDFSASQSNPWGRLVHQTWFQFKNEKIVSFFGLPKR